MVRAGFGSRNGVEEGWGVEEVEAGEKLVRGKRKGGKKGGERKGGKGRGGGRRIGWGEG
jgi:hypothetical protein